MKPRDRKLKLRRNTVMELGPEDAANVQGGSVVTITVSLSCIFQCPSGNPGPVAGCNPVPVDTEGFFCSLFCTGNCTEGACGQTRAFSNCDYCS